jgi:glutamate--cysteine ligase
MSAARQELLARPLAEASVEELSELFTSNAKPQSEWMIGAELELFSHDRAQDQPAQHDAIQGVIAALGRRRRMTGEREDGALVGLRGHGQLITLEPGGQIEFASKPHVRLKEMRDELMGYVADLRELGAERGLEFWALGYHPFETRDTIPKMPKPRYDLMRSYFSRRGGPRALDMMHLTCSVQCAVDFSDDRNLADKIRSAARASPFVSALVAASPFTAGKPNGFKSLRYQVWLETADERCGIWPEMLDDEGLTVRRYIERALRTPGMFVLRDGAYESVEPKPYVELAQEGFRGKPLTVTDFLDHLTTFFPEIRPKGYVELRGADCLPPESAVALAGVWRGLLDYDEPRRAIDERLSALSFADVHQLRRDVARFGLDAQSPIGPVRDIAKWLVDTAYEALATGTRDCADCIVPLVERAAAGRSPADDMLELAAKESIESAVARYAKL